MKNSTLQWLYVSGFGVRLPSLCCVYTVEQLFLISHASSNAFQCCTIADGWRRWKKLYSPYYHYSRSYISLLDISDYSVCPIGSTCGIHSKQKKRISRIFISSETIRLSQTQVCWHFTNEEREREKRASVHICDCMRRTNDEQLLYIWERSILHFAINKTISTIVVFLQLYS